MKAAATSSNGDVVQVPVTLGGEAVAYNVPTHRNLHLTSDVLADIFIGTITNWNDKALASLILASISELPIIAVHRADGSGTTYIFTDYLSHVSSDVEIQDRQREEVNWPANSSLGVKGNEGVAGQVRNNPGAIGYVDSRMHSITHDLTRRSATSAGHVCLADVDTVRACGGTKSDREPQDFSIVDHNRRRSYPICGYSWVMLWKNQPDAAKGKRSSICSTGW